MRSELCPIETRAHPTSHLLGHVIHLADAVQVLWGILRHAQGELGELLLQACSEDRGLCLENLRAGHAS